MSVAMFAMLLFMLVTASSMFEFHMLVAIVVMFNILELIIELLPNFPTPTTPLCVGRGLGVPTNIRDAPNKRFAMGTAGGSSFFV